MALLVGEGERCARDGTRGGVPSPAGGPLEGSGAEIEGAGTFDLSDSVVNGVAGGNAGATDETASLVRAAAGAAGGGATVCAACSTTVPAACGVGSGVGAAATASDFAGGLASGAPRPNLRPAVADLERTVRPGAAKGDRCVGLVTDGGDEGVAGGADMVVLGSGSAAAAAFVSSDSAGAGVDVPGAWSSSMRPPTAPSLMADRCAAGTTVMGAR